MILRHGQPPFRNHRLKALAALSGLLVPMSGMGFAFGSVVPLEGDPIPGKVAEITGESIRIEGAPDPLDLGNVLRIENAESGAVKAADSSALFLVGGGRVPVKTINFDADAEVFVVEVEGAGVQKLAIDVVGALLLDPEADPTRFHEVRADPTTEFDRLLIDVGAEIQVIRGLLDGFGEGTIDLSVDGETRQFPLEKVMGVVLASVAPEVPDRWVEVVSANGSVFTGNSVTLDETGNLSVHLGAGDPLKLPWAVVARVEFFSPRIAFLSDMKPKEITTAPIVALPRDPQMAANVLGGEIVVDGRKFRRGIGMPGGAEMTFSTKGYERFRAIVGIDDVSAGRGDCEVAVLSESGQEIFREQIRGGEPGKSVDIDVSGMDALTLKVIPGEDLDLADYVDWGDAVLIREEK